MNFDVLVVWAFSFRESTVFRGVPRSLCRPCFGGCECTADADLHDRDARLRDGLQRVDVGPRLRKQNSPRGSFLPLPDFSRV